MIIYIYATVMILIKESLIHHHRYHVLNKKYHRYFIFQSHDVCFLY